MIAQIRKKVGLPLIRILNFCAARILAKVYLMLMYIGLSSILPRSHRSSVGVHTAPVSAAKVWVPTEDLGNQKDTPVEKNLRRSG